jgi:hypothetical protein
MTTDTDGWELLFHLVELLVGVLIAYIRIRMGIPPKEGL